MSEVLVKERFFGITTYQVGISNVSLERETRFCDSLESVKEALKNQKKFFIKEVGAVVLKQKIVRVATFEKEVK